MTEYLPLLGILIVILGFAFRVNPMLVVPAAALATGLFAGMGAQEVVEKLGKAFNDSRVIAIPWVVLPVIGLLERFGLQERARALIASFQAATVGRLLILYLIYRQLISAIGLHSTAGHPQTVRPLVAPMAVAAAERQAELDDEGRDRIKAQAAATDNVGLFFGEDIFFAIGSIVLIQQVMAGAGIELSPITLAFWAIPTAICAFIIHSTRLILLDRYLSSLPRSGGEGDRPKGGGGANGAGLPLHQPAAGPPPHEAAPHREERS